mmetsp:Transcript_47513/g.40128  ORF Transcript_47513/g.40128 Transcript_47513/m.40128 type:complete len:81 (-) Transcript_47513:189-431(-)
MGMSVNPIFLSPQQEMFPPLSDLSSESVVVMQEVPKPSATPPTTYCLLVDKACGTCAWPNWFHPQHFRDCFESDIKQLWL